METSCTNLVLLKYITVLGMGGGKTGFDEVREG